MCGGFFCSKNALASLNVLYLMVSLILIGVGAYAKGTSIVTSVELVGGIIATGVFLLFVSILGFFGACKHHQVILFFYMIVLFMVFLIQFFVAVACLAVNEEQRTQIARKGWESASNQTIMTHIPTPSPAISGEMCWMTVKNKVGEGLRVAGGIGLFFSFTEFFGVWVTTRFRNQRDPKYDYNPRRFM